MQLEERAKQQTVKTLKPRPANSFTVQEYAEALEIPFENARKRLQKMERQGVLQKVRIESLRPTDGSRCMIAGYIIGAKEETK